MLFRGPWYVRRYPGVVASGMRPARHYLGGRGGSGLDPGPEFSTAEYLREHPEVAATGTNPLLHHLRTRAAQGPAVMINPSADDPARGVGRDVRVLRDSGLFDPDYYLQHNPPTSRPPALTPLQHFCRHGWRELRAPSPDFDVVVLGQLPRSGQRDVNPLVHYARGSVDSSPISRSPRQPSTHHRTRIRRDASVRRICLFAGFDRDGLVDEYVVSTCVS